MWVRWLGSRRKCSRHGRQEALDQPSLRGQSPPPRLFPQYLALLKLHRSHLTRHSHILPSLFCSALEIASTGGHLGAMSKVLVLCLGQNSSKFPSPLLLWSPSKPQWDPALPPLHHIRRSDPLGRGSASWVASCQVWKPTAFPAPTARAWSWPPSGA